MVMARTLGTLAALGLLTAGCAAVGPTYTVPVWAVVNAPAAQGAFESMRGDLASDAPPDDWWRLFDDPTLDALVAKALAVNTDLRAADANLERSAALLAQAKERREPDLAADYETSLGQQSTESVQQKNKPPERWIYNGGLTVAYDLDLFGAIRRGAEAAAADDQAVRAARDLVRVNVAAETARAWADICNTGAELQSAYRIVDLQQAALHLTQVSLDRGRAIVLDVNRQSGMVGEVRARIPALNARQRNAAFRLATLIGEPPEQFDRSWLSCAMPLRVKAPIPVGDGRLLLARRPDVRLAERRLAADTARIGVATAGLYPDIKLGATLGSTGLYPDLDTGLTNRFGIGPAISWDLHRTVVRDRIAAADAGAKASLAMFDGTVLKALRDTETALTNYNYSLDRLASLEAARDQDAAAARQAGTLYQGGRIGALAALDAERILANAEQVLAAGQSETSQDQVAIFLALGGGWASAPAPPSAFLPRRSR